MDPRTVLGFAALALLAQSRTAEAIQQQRAVNWCWAAAIQDVVGAAGTNTSQAEVAARLTGWPQNRPASITEVVGLVQSYGLIAWQTGRPGSAAELYSSLTSGWKMIAFVMPSLGPVGHYIVLEGIGSRGGVVVADPATGGTIEEPLADLYLGWRWADTVVVGKPTGASPAPSPPQPPSPQPSPQTPPPPLQFSNIVHDLLSNPTSDWSLRPRQKSSEVSCAAGKVDGGRQEVNCFSAIHPISNSDARSLFESVISVITSDIDHEGGWKYKPQPQRTHNCNVWVASRRLGTGRFVNVHVTLYEVDDTTPTPLFTMTFSSPDAHH